MRRKKIRRAKPSFLARLLKHKLLAVIFLLLFSLISYAFYLRFSPLKIGVLLTMTGPESLPYRQVLEWAKENSGKEIELVYVDTNTPDIKKAAEPLLNNQSIKIVIGPDTSDQAMTLAPLFIAKHKLLISPTATSADLYRAFAKQNYFWRTVESDVSQVRFILQILKQKNVKKIALIYADTSYGKTFFDWTGFYATENDMKVTSIQALNKNPDYQNLIADALEDNPSYIICATPPENTIELKREIDKQKTATKLFLTDINETDYLLKTLGTQAEWLESSRPAADPNNGFDQAYREKFHTTPPAFMATTYDAFVLAAATLSRQEYIQNQTFIPLPFMEDVSASLKKLLYHQSDEKYYKWDRLKELLAEIEKGRTPNLIGASGDIVYDLEKGVDPTNTYYSYSIIKNGEFVKQLSLPSGGGNVSAADSRASKKLEISTEQSGVSTLPPKTDFQAVVIATSKGWQNYRHQADALAVYKRLRENGVKDDKITLLITDDVPYDSKNNPKTSLYHIKDGENIYKDSQIDFSKNKVSLSELKKVLLNLNSNENTNLLLYIVDHGGSFDLKQKAGGQTGGDYTQSEGMIPFANGDILTSKDLTSVVNQMNDKKKFRQMLIIVESCYGGAMGQDIKTPNVLFLSGASAQEVSYGANYSDKIDQWLADNFTYQFLEELKKNPKASIADFYKNVYQSVAGSHVTILNYQNFGNLQKISIDEFFK